MSEHDLIRRYFANVGTPRADVVCGVGDDCALLRVPAGQELAVSIDTLVAGVHFFADCDPEGLGHKSLAVGLSDLAAMGADPTWATLALTIPAIDEAWLSGFVRGMGRLAVEHGLALVGGDTTRGPLTISVQVHGLVPQGEAIGRAGARASDRVLVSGTLGDAGLALRQHQRGLPVSAPLQRRLERPDARVAVGRHLRRLATAMIDLSDGLAADLSHILAQSGVGAELDLGALPMRPEVADAVAASGDWDLPLASGDDYELCFTLPAAREGEVVRLAAELGCPLTPVGTISSDPGLRCRQPDGAAWSRRRSGYDHFTTPA